MDSQTRHALKQDKFVMTTQSGVSWVGDHRSTVIRYSVAIVAVVIAVAVRIIKRTDRA